MYLFTAADTLARREINADTARHTQTQTHAHTHAIQQVLLVFLSLFLAFICLYSPYFCLSTRRFFRCLSFYYYLGLFVPQRGMFSFSHLPCRVTLLMTARSSSFFSLCTMCVDGWKRSSSGYSTVFVCLLSSRSGAPEPTAAA
jgi:hypothetical protein